MHTPLVTLANGARLGPYEILELIGRGGMGEVYRAVDSRLGRQVAIKVLPSHLADHPESLARFRREARAIAALSHPNIVAIFDIGTQAETPYVVTELLDGHTLRTRLHEGGKLSLEEALRISIGLAEGLAAAHEKGIIHRDLKPENVFLTTNGGVKILDFGLAAGEQGAPLLHDGMTRGEALTLIGTIGYMSPEQLKGGSLTTATDVFSLGCVMFEMLAGDMPFQRDNAIEIIAAVVRDEPFDRSDIEIPVEMREVLERCLAKDPKSRYATGGELASALRTVSVANASGHLTTAAFKKPRLDWRRNVAIAAIALFVIAMAIAATVFLRNRRMVDPGYDLQAGDITASGEARRLTEVALRADAVGNRTEAIELLREAARLDSRAPLPAAFLSSFNNVRGNVAEADRWSAETKRRLPNASSPYETMLCRYLLRDTDSTTVMALSSSLLELRPKAWRLRLGLAHFHLYRREIRAALEQLKQIDIAAPGDRRLSVVLSDRASLGDPDGAERDLNRSSLMRRPAQLAYTRARIAWSRGRYAEAARFYDAAAESATASNLTPVADESWVMSGAARIAAGDLDAAQSALDVAAIKSQQTHYTPEAVDAYTYGAYAAYRRGDAEGMERRLRAAFALVPHTSASFDELRLFALRVHSPSVPHVKPGEDLQEDFGVASLVAAREAWARGDNATARRLLQQARSEGVDSTWFAEQSALLAYDLGAPPRTTFKPDPPYPNRLRFVAIWELGRSAKLKIEN